MPRPFGVCRSRRGFTLVELCLVIATILLLAAFSLSGASVARERARQAYCANNLRQIGQAIYVYMADNDGLFPVRYGPGCNPPDSPTDEWWQVLESDGVVPEGVRCPCDPYQFVVGVESYVYNGMFGFRRSLATVPAVARKIVVSERGDAESVLGEEDYAAWRGLSQWAHFLAHSRHRGVSNYLYADGHVWAKPFDETVGEEGGNDHCNDTNQHYLPPLGAGGSGFLLLAEERTLWAGQHYNAGKVQVSVDDETVCVTLLLDNGWLLHDSHVYVEATPPPSSAPGQFPYKHEGLGGVLTDQFCIPWSDVGSVCTFYVAVHGIVNRTEQVETTWAEGVAFGISWAMYFPVTVCGTDTGPAAPVEQWTLAVQSEGVTGVPITGNPAGTTNYWATLDDGTAVSLTAPATVSSGGKTYQFQRWTVNGVQLPAGEVTITFTMTQDTTAQAGYKKK